MLPSDCCSDDRLLTLAKAVTAALATVQPIRESDPVPLLETFGRVLASDLPARLDVPPHDNSAMDGFALYLADLHPDQSTRLPVLRLASHCRPSFSKVTSLRKWR